MIAYDRAQLKQAAKRAMKTQRPHPMLITLLFTILVNIGTQVVNRILGAASGLNGLTTAYAQALIENQDPAYAIQYALLAVGPQRLVLALLMGGFVAGIITTLWTGLMHTGYSGFCLDMVRGRQPQTGALFRAFPQWAGVLLTQFLTALFCGLWGLLFTVGLIAVIFVDAMLFVGLIESEALFVIILLAAYIAFLAGLVWVTLRYAMVDFLIADQGITGMDAIRESKRLMRGNTGRLFTLNLSFIGWYLLEIGVILVFAMIVATAFGAGIASMGGVDPMYLMAGASLGIFGLMMVAVIAAGVFNLWLTPYITGAQALFYDWARGVDSTQPPIGPNQGGWGGPQQTQYTWNPTSGPNAGTGIGPGPQGGDAPQPPKPKSPKDDPWD